MLMVMWFAWVSVWFWQSLHKDRMRTIPCAWAHWTNLCIIVFFCFTQIIFSHQFKPCIFNESWCHLNYFTSFNMYALWIPYPCKCLGRTNFNWTISHLTTKIKNEVNILDPPQCQLVATKTVSMVTSSL